MPATINQLDRSKAPAVKPVQDISFHKYDTIELDNGIPCYIVNAGTIELVKIELLIDAGKWFEPNSLISALTAKCLKSGTAAYTSSEIVEQFDFYGSTFKAGNGLDLVSVKIYCLNKFLPQVLPLVQDCLLQSIFPEKEVNIHLSRLKQKRLVQNEKVDYIASNKLRKVVFGAEHPYGHHYSLDDIDNFDSSLLIDYHKKQFIPANCKMIVSGLVNTDVLSLINRYLGTTHWLNTPQNEVAHTIKPSEQLDWNLPKENSMQSAIRIGMPSFNKTHKDYYNFGITNTIFGGYFGSRLMANIREDKGYTYGIYSHNASLRNGGYFYISTETANKYTNAVLDEIQAEIKKLQTEPISQDELNMVKQYMLGKTLEGIDGAFNISNVLTGLVIYNLDNQYLNDYVKAVKTINAETIMETAQQYYNFDKMYKVVVG